MLCWILGHGWEHVMTAFGRRYTRCRRCHTVHISEALTVS